MVVKDNMSALMFIDDIPSIMSSCGCKKCIFKNNINHVLDSITKKIQLVFGRGRLHQIALDTPRFGFSFL